MRLFLYLIIWFPLTFILFVACLVLTITILFNRTVKTSSFGNNNLYSQDKAVNKNIIFPSSDFRIKALSNFFTKYNSPLLEKAEYLVFTADSWGIDYTLIPAISMQESGGCKNIPIGSHNCWGFGIYGDKKTVFASYEKAIEQVAKVIKQTYIKQGYTNPTLLEDKWTPSSRGSWSYGVNFFIGKIKEEETKLLVP